MGAEGRLHPSPSVGPERLLLPPSSLLGVWRRWRGCPAAPPGRGVWGGGAGGALRPTPGRPPPSATSVGSPPALLQPAMSPLAPSPLSPWHQPSVLLLAGDVTSATTPDGHLSHHPGGVTSATTPLQPGSRSTAHPTFSFRQEPSAFPGRSLLQRVFPHLWRLWGYVDVSDPQRGAILNPSLCKPRLSPGELVAAWPGSGAGRRKFCGVFLQGLPSPPESAVGLDPPATAANPPEPKLIPREPKLVPWVGCTPHGSQSWCLGWAAPSKQRGSWCLLSHVQTGLWPSLLCPALSDVPTSTDSPSVLWKIRFYTAICSYLRRLRSIICDFP